MGRGERERGANDGVAGEGKKRARWGAWVVEEWREVCRLSA